MKGCSGVPVKVSEVWLKMLNNHAIRPPPRDNNESTHVPALLSNHSENFKALQLKATKFLLKISNDDIPMFFWVTAPESVMDL